jgi:phosphatidate cytidylyltransferase
MLRQRVITAVLLLLVLLPALFHPRIEAFAVLSLLMLAAAGWEWARLNGQGRGTSIFIGGGLGVALAVSWWQGALDHSWRTLWLIAGAAWVLLAVLTLGRGVHGWARWPVIWRLPLGLLLLACAWLAMVQARQIGLSFLLSVFLLVWTADVAAYFGGKRFGQRKLAPSVSPGKSWEGAISGLIGVVLLAMLWIIADQRGWADGGSLYSRLWAHGPWLAVLALLFLTAMSVLGDLIESLVKRSAGVKDSSQLLPGHGGVLDRVDALLPVLPLAMMLATL